MLISNSYFEFALLQNFIYSILIKLKKILLQLVDMRMETVLYNGTSLEKKL